MQILQSRRYAKRSVSDGHAIANSRGMQILKHMLPAAALATMLATGAGAQSTAPDNTRTNQRDRADGQSTADSQKLNPSDRALSQKIRQAIVKDKSLSTYAHNVKIISENGTVTLKGPVRSDEELRAVVAKATSIVGDKNQIVNQLSVTPQ